MNTNINTADESDQEEILDTEWITQLKSNENKYNDFYKEPVKSVIVYLLYINKENELQHIHKDRCLIDNNRGILNRDIIITFIKRYHHMFSVNYKLFSILKYNIDLEPTEVEHFSSKKNESMYENRFMQTEKHLNDIHFKDTIHMFQDLNALFFIFQESLPKMVQVPVEAQAPDSASTQDKTTTTSTTTKRIIMSVTKRNNKNNNNTNTNNKNGKNTKSNHAKTKRMYHIKKT
jgi:hypothetical protein